MKVEKYVCDVCEKELNEGDEYLALKDEGIICRACHETKMFPCEVYSRVVGYIRPVKQWNPGKQAEYKDRVEFNPIIHMD